jgi:hypothetical protein
MVSWHSLSCTYHTRHAVNSIQGTGWKKVNVKESVAHCQPPPSLIISPMKSCPEAVPCPSSYPS